MTKFFAQISIFIFAFILISCQSKKTDSIEFSDGIYKGEVDKKGKKNGKGFYSWHDGSTFEGDFKNSLRHGNGIFQWSNGEYYKGDYLEDERTGQGIYRWPDGSSYEGSFLKGKRHGDGVYQSNNGSVYEGKWFDDLQHGEGKLTNPDKTFVRGIWRNGKLITKPVFLPTASSKPNSEEMEIETLSPYDVEKNNQYMPEKKNLAPTTIKVINSTETISEETLIKPTIEIEQIVTNDEHNSTHVNTLNQTEHSKQTMENNFLPNEKQLPETINDAKVSTNSSGSNIWTGTVEEAEIEFITDLINGIDTVSSAKSKIPFTGKMQILNQEGALLGEVNLVDGLLHGEEVFMDESGAITERNIWENGIRQK